MEVNKDILNRAISAIDDIVAVALSWMKGDESFIQIEFMKIFEGMSPEQISHYMDMWDGDFARFYLNSDETMKRKIFNYYNIPLENGKYTGKEVYEALLGGVPGKELFPMESFVVYLFYLMAYNNSLLLLDKILPEAFERIKTAGINLYGNGLDWSNAWQILSNEEKEYLVEYQHLI